MTALTKGLGTGIKLRAGQEAVVKLAADAVVFNGGGVCVDLTTGYGESAKDAANLKSVGMAIEDVDNTGGANGEKVVKLNRHFVQRIETSVACTEAWNQKTVYWVDDNTVALIDPGNAVKAGKVMEVDGTTHVYVDHYLND